MSEKTTTKIRTGDMVKITSPGTVAHGVTGTVMQIEPGRIARIWSDGFGTTRVPFSNLIKV